jgi:hypothetical protein
LTRSHPLARASSCLSAVYLARLPVAWFHVSLGLGLAQLVEDNSAVERHEDEPTVALQGKLLSKLHDRRTLPVLDPAIARESRDVFVDLAVTCSPGCRSL